MTRFLKNLAWALYALVMMMLFGSTGIGDWLEYEIGSNASIIVYVLATTLVAWLAGIIMRGMKDALAKFIKETVKVSE